MSETSNNTRLSNDDEIDLLDLSSRIGRSIRKMTKASGRGLLYVFVFLLKKWLPLSISLLIGITISYFLKVTSNSFYTSDMVLRVNLKESQIIEDERRPLLSPAADMITYINRLQTYSRERNIQALTEAISVSKNQVDNIIDISAFWIIDQGNDGTPDYVDYTNNHNIYDTLNLRMLDRLDIRVRTKSPDELTHVKNGILTYINSDSLFQHRNKIRLRQSHELLAKYVSDISALDSLQNVKFFEETRNRIPQNGSQMVFLQNPTTQMVFYDKYNLYDQKQTLETEIDLFSSIVTVLSDFSVPSKPDNGLLYYGRRIIPVILLITLLILIIIHNEKKLKEVYKKY